MKLFCCSKLITLLTLYKNSFFGIHANPHFYSPASLLPGNTSWRIFLECYYQHTGTWQTWKCYATTLQHQNSQRVFHIHPKYHLVQLLMTPHLYSGKSVDHISTFVLSTLQFLSPWPVISLLPQLHFAGGQDFYSGVVGRSSVHFFLLVNIYFWVYCWVIDNPSSWKTPGSLRL